MFQNILVPTDGSELSGSILIPVHRILAAQTVGSITLLRVLPAPEGGTNAERLFETVSDTLRAVCQRLKDEGVRAVHRIERGDPVERIVQVALQTHPDLVAMATHGLTGIQRWVRGSVAEGVLRHCSSPLLLCNTHGIDMAGPYAGFKRILVPLDGSPLAEAILPLVTETALLYGAEIVLMRVDDAPEPADETQREDRVHFLETRLSEAKDTMDLTGIPKLSYEVRFGNAAEEILDAVDRLRVDMVAMSTHGRTGFQRLRFGSVAEAVMRHCQCPILVRREEIRPSP